MGKSRFDNVPSGVEQTRHSLENYGLSREDKANTTSYQNTPAGRGASLVKDLYLSTTDGGRLHSPIGFDKKTAIIDGSNTVNVQQGGTHFVPRIVLDGTTSTTLDTLSNPLFEGQKVYLQAYSSGTITIGTAGNIQTGISLTANHIIELIYDFDVAKWIMPEDAATGGATGDNLGDHTATTDLIMTTHNVELTTGALTIGTAGGVSFSGTNSVLSIGVAGSIAQLFTGNDCRFYKNVAPSASSTWDLGASSKSWNVLYTDQIEMQNGIKAIDLNGGNLFDVDFAFFNSSATSWVHEDAGGNLEVNAGSGDLELFSGALLKLNLSPSGVELYSTQNCRGNPIEQMGQISFNSTGIKGYLSHLFYWVSTTILCTV